MAQMVRRVYVEKKAGFDVEAVQLNKELADFLNKHQESKEAGGQIGLKKIRIFKRYDVSGLSREEFEKAVAAVFSEPQCDRVFRTKGIPGLKKGGGAGNVHFFGIEYLPGQYDQRADSAEQCIELVTGTRPRVKTAVFYLIETTDKPLSEDVFGKIKNYMVNPVDSRISSIDLPAALEDDQNDPPDIQILTGFTGKRGACGTPAAMPKKQANEWLKKYNLAMSAEDLEFCRKYFIKEGRDPTLTELRLLDTYWSDHCRHTTFTTILEEINLKKPSGKAGSIENALDLYRKARKEVYGGKTGSRPYSLMDMATIGAKVLKKRGLADDVDVSAEVNACTIKVKAEFAADDPGKGNANKSRENWLLLFKNETHNHPTEIEPFGGAATCLGGAIRDPLSGRAYVHQAMRITGGGDPRNAVTMRGKLPQIKLAREASHGYSSYGNQIGLATGQVSEFYHPGFLAKRLELGAVTGAVPQAWVRREEPAPGDVVILVGGRTGRDGIGGATGSSKVHSGESVEVSGAEVQKGNAVEERKLQRLFRNPACTRLIKRCNDFGAGGVSVAVGELAAGLDINLDAMPKKYAGLDGTELAISESQERMAVVTSRKNAGAFIALAAAENLEAVIIAMVTYSDQVSEGDPGSAEGQARMRMMWRGKTIVDLSRGFLNSNGAPRRAAALLPLPPEISRKGASKNIPADVLLDNLERELASIRCGSRRGLQERFDGSIGAGSVLFPWGGGEQGTPECGMAALLPSLDKKSLTASIMTFGYDPYVMERDPYLGAKGSVLEALAKFACLGGDYKKARMSFQEYFKKPDSKESWGIPAAALLGALEIQISLGIPAIGGKDSMSGNYKNGDREIRVPPTFVAFAAGAAPAAKIRSGALSGKPGNLVILLCGCPGENGSAEECFRENMKILEGLTAKNLVHSAYPVGPGGIAAALAVTAFGNMTGVEAYADVFPLVNEFDYQGSVLAEVEKIPENLRPHPGLHIAGRTGINNASGDPVFRIVSGDDEPETAEMPLAVLRRAYEYPLSQVYPQNAAGIDMAVKRKLPPFVSTADTPCAASAVLYAAHASPKKPRRSSRAVPLAILPVFPGTNCEWDMERAFREAGADTRLVIFRNQNRNDIRDSLEELEKAINEAQIFALSGGFSAGDEQDGSGKFIANVLRSQAISAALVRLLEKRDGLVLGICNGFQALIKTGLLPYGKFTDGKPTLTGNKLGRHVSRMVRTRVMPSISPWLALDEPGTVHVIPVSHGEGRVVIDRAEAQTLFNAGQIPFCYADAGGNPALEEPDNPNGSDFAIEGICSPDGRILGKMGHSERAGEFVHINIPGNKKQRIFEAGVKYFS